MHLEPQSNNRAILTGSWESCTALTVTSCDKVRLPLARGFGLTTDLSYSITYWSSFLDYSAISTVRGILLTDHRLMQRKTSWQPVSSSTSQANFCLLLATEALQTSMVPQCKSHLCVLKLGLAPTQRHVSAGCIDLLNCDQFGGTLCLLYSGPHHWCVWEKHTWIKLPKGKNIFPLVFSRSQLTSLLLFAQSWTKFEGSLKKVCRINFAVWLWKDNLYHQFLFTQDLPESPLCSAKGNAGDKE